MRLQDHQRREPRQQPKHNIQRTAGKERNTPQADSTTMHNCDKTSCNSAQGGDGLFLALASMLRVSAIGA
eukprot:4757439-Amphidinium_carterae.1